jgi:hypothetical protein
MIRAASQFNQYFYESRFFVLNHEIIIMMGG